MTRVIGSKKIPGVLSDKLKLSLRILLSIGFAINFNLTQFLKTSSCGLGAIHKRHPSVISYVILTGGQ